MHEIAIHTVLTVIKGKIGLIAETKWAEQEVKSAMGLVNISKLDQTRRDKGLG